MDAEQWLKLKGVLAEWESIRAELRQRYTWNVQAIAFVVAGLGAALAYGVTATVSAEADSRRWFALTASVSAFAVVIVGILFARANFQSIARNAAYIRLFLEKQHPGLQLETCLHEFRSQSGQRLGQTGVMGMMYLAVATAILAASLVALIAHEGWYLFPAPVAMFALVLYFALDMCYQASERWHVDDYWTEVIDRRSSKGVNEHAS
jgi:hypothetical protein